MPFENATPRPWAVNVYIDPLNASARIESKGAHGIDNDGFIIADLFGPDAQGNAELIVTAVNAHAQLCAAAEPIIQKLEANEQWLVRNYSKMGSDDEEFSITQGEARALEAALKLARAET